MTSAPKKKHEYDKKDDIKEKDIKEKDIKEKDIKEKDIKEKDIKEKDLKETKEKDNSKESKESKESENQEDSEMQNALSKLPKEAQEKLKQIKAKIDKFQKQIVEKFDKYIVGVALLPPPRPAEGEKHAQPPKEIHVLVLIDDSDSKKMTKEELRTKLGTIIEEIAKETDPDLAVQTLILSDVWQSCYDGKHEILQTIAMSAPIYDTGMLSAIKIAEIHKTMVLKKFEKYIVSYVLAGSLVQGRATKESDIDVFMVIDDTDVKKMTRAELKDKLRAIIIGMGIEAGEITGIRNKLNIQVYILTDFWDNIKEANPIIFTFLRDGVPLYDRGIFMPWKQLLRMGKVKPSMEAIDMYMSTGESMLKRVQMKLNDVGMEDIFYAILTPSQAALMLYGVSPPTPKETAEVLREIFVKKEKLLEEKYPKLMERVVQLRKELEHGTKKEVSGSEIDELLKESAEYLKRIKKLFSEIEARKEQEAVMHMYDTVMTIIRDCLKTEGIESSKDEEIEEHFERELVNKAKVPSHLLRSLKDLMQAKKDYDKGKLTKVEVEKVKRESAPFIKFLIEYLQRKRGRELERARIRVKHGSKFGEILLMDKIAFIIHDVDVELKQISKAEIKPDGSLGTVHDSNLEEFEHHIANTSIPSKTFIKEPMFEGLKNIFGRDVEILMNY